MNKYIKVILVGCLASIALMGCAPKSGKNFNSAVKQVNEVSMDHHLITPVDNGLWVSGKSVVRSDDNRDDVWLSHKTVLVSEEMISFKTFVSSLQSYGEPVIITATPAALKLIAKGGATSSSSGSSGSSSSATSSSSGSSSTSSNKGTPILDMHINGTFLNLFDSVAAQLNISWHSIGDHRIEFYRFTEKSFILSVLQNKSTIKTGQDSGAGYAATNTLSADTWQDLKSTVAGIISSEGTATFSPSLGMIIVRDVPSVIARITTIIDAVNELMSKQVLVDLHMVRYRSDQGMDAAADLKLAFGTASRTLGITSIGNNILGSGSASAAIINPSSKYNGSTLAMQALQTRGSTSLVVHRSVIAANNTSVPFVLKTTETYLASIGGGSVSNGVATAPTVTPGTTDSSINIFVYPRILSDSRIMMQVGLKIKSIDSIRSITTGTGATSNTIEAPNNSDISFEQTLFLQDGATLMLSGSGIQKSSKTSSTGVLGGSRKKSARNQELVLMITPHIVE